jgi:hypothetical protein
LIFQNDKPASISWSHDQNLKEFNANDLKAGIYSVTITDSYGCKKVENFILPISEPKIENLKPIPSNCLDKYGEISFNVPDGGGLTKFTLLNKNNTIVQDIVTGYNFKVSNLNSGLYKINLTDNYGCKLNLEKTVVISSKFGIAPLHYVWSDGYLGAVRPNTDFNKTYSVTITDATGCAEVIYIGKPNNNKFPLFGFIAFPTPGDQFVEVRSVNNDEIMIAGQAALIDLNGRVLISKDFQIGEKIILNTSVLNNGLYYLIISGEDFNQIIKLPVLH